MRRCVNVITVHHKTRQNNEFSGPRVKLVGCKSGLNPRWITSLGEERANFGAFRAFVRFALVCVCLFPFPLGVWEGLRFVIVALPGLFYYFFFILLAVLRCGPSVSLTLCCFVVYSTRRFVLSCVILVLCFSVFLALQLPRLGSGEIIFVLFGTFVRFGLVWFCLFPLPLGVWEGLRLVTVALPGLFFSLILKSDVF